MSRGPWRPRQEAQTYTSSENIPLICTTAEAAQLLRCTPEYVSRLACFGILPGFKAGKGWRFHRGALFEYMDQQAQAGAPIAGHMAGDSYARA